MAVSTRSARREAFAAKLAIHQQVAEIAAVCAYDPLAWVEVAYKWNAGELEGHPGPRTWQRKALRELRDHLVNPETRHTPFMMARASGHGIGKSAFFGMIVNWALSTMPDAKVLITANTETQLRTKTSPELAKWMRLSITDDWFDIQATSITGKGDHKSSWRADLVPWSEHNTEAFAGAHNARKRMVLLFDEASAIHNKVWTVAEGALVDADTELIWIVFGNPTRAEGRFRECFRKYSRFWRTEKIDARTVEGHNKEMIQIMEDTYGEDSDEFKIRVRGEFPSLSAYQIFAEADVKAAMARELAFSQYNYAPKIIGVDPAWTGGDKTVAYLRQGLYSKKLFAIDRNDNDYAVATMIAQHETTEKADAVFIDFGMGTGIKSAGDLMGRSWRLVNFGEASNDPGCLNKRAEMCQSLNRWIKEGGALEKDDLLAEELNSLQVVADRLDGKFQLESKKAMAARGLPSPNHVDALMVTFAYPVIKQRHYDDLLHRYRNYGEDEGEYDAYANV